MLHIFEGVPRRYLYLSAQATHREGTELALQSSKPATANQQRGKTPLNNAQQRTPGFPISRWHVVVRIGALCLPGSGGLFFVAG